MSYHKIIRNSSALFVAILINNACLFFINVILARTMTQVEYGAIVFVMSLAAIIMLFFDFGIYDSARVFLPKRLQEKSKLETGVSSAFELSFYAGLLASIFIFTLSFFIPESEFRNARLYLRIVSIWPVLFSSIKGIRGIFGGFQEAKYLLISNLSTEPLRRVILIGAVILNAGVLGILAGWAFSYAVSLIFLFVVTLFFFKSKGIKFRPHPFKWLEDKKEILHYGIHLFVPFIAVFLIPNILKSLLGFLSTARDLSFFAVCMNLATLNLVLIKPLEMAILPAASELSEKNKLASLEATANIIQKYLIVAGLFLLSMFLYFSRDLLGLVYGDQYAGASAVLSVLAVAIFFEMNKAIVDPLLKASGNARIVSTIEFVKITAAVGLSLLLIFRYGAIGVALAFLASAVLGIILKYYYAHKKLKFAINAKAIIQGFVLAALIALCVKFRINFALFTGIFAIFVIGIFRMITRDEAKIIIRKTQESFGK